MSVFADFAKAFVNSIRRVVHGYDEGRVIFDRYIENSLKAQTRAKRTSKIEPVKFDINDETNIKHDPLKVLLSHIETKSQLTEHLGKALLKSFEGSEFVLVVDMAQGHIPIKLEHSVMQSRVTVTRKQIH